MGKRLQRISRNNIIEKQNELLNIDLNTVLISGSVFQGKIIKWNNNNCYFKDHRNHVQYFSVLTISEIITDQPSSY